MAGRTPRPWFRKSRGEWYVTVAGRSHRLGLDKADAERKCLLLRAGVEPPPREQGRSWLFASEVADRFHTWLQNERSASTLRWYCQYLEPFKQQFMMARADELSVDAVRSWVNGKWSTQASRRAGLRAVKAAFRKAAEEVGLRSPLLHLSLPGETVREHFVSRAEYRTIISAITDSTFAELIQFVWQTGCRPQEAFLGRRRLRNGRAGGGAGSAFLAADLGITPEIREDHASYIECWLKVLKDDRRAIITAASLAAKAVEYLHGVQPRKIDASIS